VGRWRRKKLRARESELCVCAGREVKRLNDEEEDTAAYCV